MTLEEELQALRRISDFHKEKPSRLEMDRVRVWLVSYHKAGTMGLADGVRLFTSPEAAKEAFFMVPRDSDTAYLYRGDLLLNRVKASSYLHFPTFTTTSMVALSWVRQVSR